MLNNAFGNAIASRASDNSQNGARPIGQLSGTRKFRDSVGISDKVDFYSFTLTGRSSFNLSLNKLKNNVDVFLQQGKQVIARSTNGGKKAEAIATTLEAGTYYVRVNQKSGNSKYKLTLNALPLDGGTDPETPPPSRRLLVTTGSRSAALGLGYVDLNTGNISPFPPGNSPFTFKDIATFGNETFAIAPNLLFKVDLTAGTTTPFSNTLGPSISVSALGALGFTSSGALYSTGTDGGFYRIDTTTGKANLISKIPGFSGGGDIAFDAVSGRFLATSKDIRNGTNDSLYSIGLAGDAALIGNIGFGNVDGLTFNNGTLYGFNTSSQIIINPTTGVGTLDKLTNPTTLGINGVA